MANILAIRFFCSHKSISELDSSQLRSNRPL